MHDPPDPEWFQMSRIIVQWVHRKNINMKILCFGSLNLDYVYGVDHFVMPAETLAASSLSIHPGGKGLNQSIALARAGADVYHGGCCGQGGKALRTLLENNGVNVTYLKDVDAPQGSAVIQVTPDGENCILIAAGSNACVSEGQIREALSAFEEGDYLLLQNEINNNALLVSKAHEKGMRIILNPSPYNEKLSDVDFSKLSWLFVNETEAKQITGSDDPETVWKIIHERYPSLSFLLTLGEEGSHAWKQENGTIIHHYEKALHVSVIDTTGAGDTYTGFFVSSLMKELPLDVCMKTASAAAALSVTRPGAADSIPSLEEVKEAPEE